MWKISIILMAFTLATPAIGSELWCKALKKANSETDYTPDYIEKQQFGLFIRNYSSGATISRCSKDFQGKLSCDEYEVDHIAKSRNGNEMYYYFRGHLSVLLTPSLTFVENASGTVAWGKCWRQ